MNAKLDDLIGLLREELQHYGELLALLDQQQEQIIQRASDDVINTSAAIDAQLVITQTSRAARDASYAKLCEAAGLPGDAAFKAVSKHLPEARRAQIEALIQENNALLLRVQARARQNHV